MHRLGFATMAAVTMLGLARGAAAYEYPLQFTPNAGARGLVVAAYSYHFSTVVGNCSYYTEHSGSGRGGGYKIYKTYYNQTCTWDFYGNLLNVAQGAPTAPAPLYVDGTRTVYAKRSASHYAGTDSALPTGGFVFTRGAHYAWLTSNTYQDLQQQVYSFTLTLKSDGEIPLDVASVSASANLAKVSVASTSCSGDIPAGGTCDVTVTYDPTKLSSPTGLAYDTLTVALVSNSGQAYEFIQSYTISVKIPPD